MQAVNEPLKEWVRIQILRHFLKNVLGEQKKIN
jgi:hypothetical protein